MKIMTYFKKWVVFNYDYLQVLDFMINSFNFVNINMYVVINFLRAVNHVSVAWPVKVLSARRTQECVNVNQELSVEHVIGACQDFGITPQRAAYVIRFADKLLSKIINFNF